MSAMSDAESDLDRRQRLLTREARALETIASIARPLRSLTALFQAVAVAVAIVLLIATLGDVVMIVFAAVLLAVLLHGAGQRVGRLLHIGTGGGLLIVIVGMIAFFGGLGWWQGASLAHQAVQLQDSMIQQLGALRLRMQHTEWGQRLLQELPFGLGNVTPGETASQGGGGQGGGGGNLPHLAGVVAGALWSVLGLLGTLGVILVSALYLAAAPGSYLRGVVALLPSHHRPAGRRVLDHLGHTLWGWLVGQFLDMLVVGVLSGIGLLLLGMPLAFILALIAGLMNFVPYIGAIVGAVPAVLIALSISSHEALFVGLLYLAVQTLEGNVTAPLIQRRTTHLPPAVSIVSQTALGVIFGLFGVILATPFTAAVIAAVQSLQEESAEHHPVRDGRP